MSHQSKEHPDISYLKQDEIGKVLAKGLAELYVKQPQFPIDYLAKWLLNFSIAQENEKSLKSKVVQKQNLQHIYQESLKVKEQEQQKKVVQQQAYDKIDSDYEQKLQEHKYHEELLLQDFPNFLELRKKLTGCYIGFLDYPTKEITAEDDEENAHLDQNAQKLIKYIGYSDSHKEIIEGKTLNLDQGVTGDVFQPKEPPADNQQEEGQPLPVVDDFVYIPNVIKNERMFYFKIPKLGAYMAVPLFYNSCLNENSFDKSLEQRLEFLKQKVDQKTEFEAKKAEFEKQIQEKEDAQEDVTELQEAWQAEQENFQEIVEPAFPSIQRQFVTCIDTLGQDREISVEERKYMDQKVKLFAKCWEASENEQLNQDLNKQIKYLEGISFQFAEMAEKYNQEEEEFIKEKEEVLAEFKEKGEDILLYETNCLRLEKLNALLNEPETRKILFLIKDFRVVKFQGLIQTMMYFIEYKKEDINIPGTNQLNWKKVKNFINDNDFLQKFLKYNHRGAKKQNVPAYAMLNRLLHRCEKYSQEETDKYNLAFGRLFKFFVLTLKLRKENILIRRKQKERQKQERLEKQAEAEARAQKKIEALAEKKNSLKDEEEIAAFDEKEFEEQWDQENPEIEIPPEVEDEEDNDLEGEE